MVGMTRALIVDPEMPNKAIKGELNTINACIGCLQACIGHYHKGLTIGCVQNPYAGKEGELISLKQRVKTKKHVVVIGAGPAGLQAAITADTQGHHVTLIEQEKVMGGLLQTLRKAPMRQEMAETMLDNYSRKLEKSKIKIQLGRRISKADLVEMKPDVIICAVGSRPYLPHVKGVEDPRVITVDNLFSSHPKPVGNRVLVFDFAGDWPGIEAAIYLQEKGHKVTLFSAKLHIGQEVHQYLRNEYLKKLYQLKVNLKPHFDFGGIVDDKVIIRNLFSHEKEEVDEWDSIILAYGRIPNTELYEEVKGIAPVVNQIGDCLAPRTIEEATYEGLVTVLNLGQTEVEIPG
jgi:NADPH-dependent 2,4-dienoyl-CoA reductase/sulfur reductase-like enzyme